MKTIASLKGPEFLRAVNRARHAVAEFAQTTHLLDLRKIMPENLPRIPENATDEQKTQIAAQRDAMLEAQGRKNLSAMLDRALEEEPEQTYKLLQALIVPEDGQSELDGYDVLMAGLEILTTPKVMDFFTLLLKSVRQITDD